MNSLSQSDNTKLESGDNTQISTKQTFFLKKTRGEEDSKAIKNLPSLTNMPNVQVVNYRPGMKNVQVPQKDTSSRLQQQQQQRISNSIKNMNDSLTQETASQKSIKETVEEYPMEILQNYFPQIDGPQLQLSNSYISFIVDTGLVAKDSITVKNNGTASIYYQWVRVQFEKFNNNSIHDPNEKFFCHHEKNVIKPGESKRFVFSFISQLTGIFYEEWTLKCEPPTMTPLPILQLSGEAIQRDNLVKWREQFDIATYTTHINKTCGEIVNDIIGVVRTPTPPLPDLENPDVCRAQFQRLNSSLHLYYNSLLMKWFRVLEKDLYEELKIDPQTQWWNMDVHYIENLISKVPDIDNQEWFEWRYQELIDLSKKPPVERTTLYPEFDQFIKDLVTEIPTIADTTRKELDMWDYVFKVPKEEDPTELEIKQKNDQYTKMKAEWVQKTKKKKWGEEEDKKMVQEYRKQFSDKITHTVGNFVEFIETNDGLKRLGRKIQAHEQPGLSYFQSLMRKQPLKDLELEGQRVLVRGHLQLNTSLPNVKELMIQFGENLMKEKEEEKRRLDEQRLNQEKLAQDKKQGKKPPAGQGGKNEKGEGDLPPVPETQNYDLSFLDQNNLAEIIETVKYILDHLGKLVILMLSYGDPVGEYHPLLSLKFFADYLQTKIDQQIIFNDGVLIENFSEKMEADSFPENSLVLLENCFFKPEEIRTRYDRQTDSLVQYSIEEVNPYKVEVEEYCIIMVIEDQFSLFKNYTSINHFEHEYKVLGLTIANEVLTTGYAVWKECNHFSVFIGGQLTPEQLMAIDTLLEYADTIFLSGETAIKFMLTIYNHKEFARVQLSDLEREVIGRVLERGNPAKIHFPNDYLVYKLPLNGEFTQQWQEQVQTKATLVSIQKETLTAANAVFADQLMTIVDLGENSLAEILEQINIGHQIIWIDSPLDIDSKHVSFGTQAMARALFTKMEEKQLRQEEGQKTVGVIYDFQQDPIIFISGDQLNRVVNSFPLVEQKPQIQEIGNEGEGEESEIKEEGKEEEKTPVVQEEVKESEVSKPNNIQQISDFYIKDSSFSLKLVSGQYIQGLESVHSYAKKSENNFDDEIIDLFHKAMELQEQQSK